MSAGNDRIFARALVSAMNDDVGQPPEEVLARVLGETERVRPLPRLVALVVEPPIVMPARVVVGIRRSRLLIVAAALLIATTFVASGIAGAWVERLTAPSKPPDALERLQSLGTVRIAVSPDGAADSFDADVARALAERLGLPVRMVAVPTSDLTASERHGTWRCRRSPNGASTATTSWSPSRTTPGPARSSFPRVRRDVARRRPGPADLRRRGRSGRTLAHGSHGLPWPQPCVRPAAPERDDPSRHRRRVPRRPRGRHGPRGRDRDDVAGRRRGANGSSVGRKSPARTPGDRCVARRARSIGADRGDRSTLDDMRRDGTLGRYSTTRFGADLTVQP